MKCSVTGRHVEITPALRQLINRNVEKLERVLNDSAVSAQVVLAVEKYRRMAELVLHVRGDHTLLGVGEGATWPAAVRAAAVKVSQQAHTLKGKWETRRRRATPAKAVGPAVVPRAAGAPRVVRDTRYIVRPMGLAEAAAAVGTPSGAFLVFRNNSTDAVSVLYRRPDGRLGLIEPEG
jgi:putative sigma-54 modulation protein